MGGAGLQLSPEGREGEERGAGPAEDGGALVEQVGAREPGPRQPGVPHPGPVPLRPDPCPLRRTARAADGGQRAGVCGGGVGKERS